MPFQDAERRAGAVPASCFAKWFTLLGWEVESADKQCVKRDSHRFRVDKSVSSGHPAHLAPAPASV
ncbi:hypothetical protein AtDm6_0343 [Acetobacter tropicalis]|uniref:Uncharacterized protein n=1 Tax=Acetobacter tropicalis TaxID=104102 RepID=A0A094YZE1_9PROT|nr:hypothetical protein AtDm6_0343 [Acetobacter tropicalis]